MSSLWSPHGHGVALTGAQRAGDVSPAWVTRRTDHLHHADAPAIDRATGPRQPLRPVAPVPKARAARRSAQSACRPGGSEHRLGPLNPTATIELAPFQVFTTVAPEESEHALRVRPLARTTALSLYVRAFADGGGEDGLHAHPDDAIWLVLEGHASFFGENGRALGELGPRTACSCPRSRATGSAARAPTSWSRSSPSNASHEWRKRRWRW